MYEQGSVRESAPAPTLAAIAGLLSMVPGVRVERVVKDETLVRLDVRSVSGIDYVFQVSS